MKTNKSLLKEALKLTMPVFAGYLFLGIGFAILLLSNGFPWWLAPVMSLVIYAGAMQYAAVGILLAPVFNPLNIVLVTLLINARHIFYGLSLLQPYSEIKKFRPYVIFAMTDETFSLASSLHLSGKEYPNDIYLYISVLDHLYWIFGGTIGAILGSAIPFNTQGIDFVLTALFFVIFIDQWLEQKNHSSAMIGLLATLFCLIVFGPNLFMLPAMILIILIFALQFKKEEALC